MTEADDFERRPCTAPCADCGTPVDIDPTDTHRVTADIRCEYCGGDRRRAE